MRIVCLLVLFSLWLTIPVRAGASEIGVSLGYGTASGAAEHIIFVTRAGLVKDFASSWWVSPRGYLSGYHELSYSHWRGGDESVNAVAWSPVFKYYFDAEPGLGKFYFEMGVGLSYIDKTWIASRNLSSHFHFEDRIGFGTRLGVADLNFRYLHYSNADFELPNDGIDIFLATLIRRF